MLHHYDSRWDNVRHGLNRDLGFTDADRVENVRRVSEVSKLMVDAGLITLVSFISPFASEQQMTREMFDKGAFVRTRQLSLPRPNVVTRRDCKKRVLVN